MNMNQLKTTIYKFLLAFMLNFHTFFFVIFKNFWTSHTPTFIHSFNRWVEFNRFESYYVGVTFYFRGGLPASRSCQPTLSFWNMAHKSEKCFPFSNPFLSWNGLAGRDTTQRWRYFMVYISKTIKFIKKIGNYALYGKILSAKKCLFTS